MPIIKERVYRTWEEAAKVIVAERYLEEDRQRYEQLDNGVLRLKHKSQTAWTKCALCEASPGMQRYLCAGCKRLVGPGCAKQCWDDEKLLCKDCVHNEKVEKELLREKQEREGGQFPSVLDLEYLRAWYPFFRVGCGGSVRF